MAEQDNSGDSLRPHSAGWPKPEVDAATKFRSLKEILAGLPVDGEAAEGSKKPMNRDFPPTESAFLGELMAHTPDFALPVLEDFSREEATEEKKKKKCCHCEVEKTVQWREGPDGPLCNACGLRYRRSGKLDPEYRPANSPAFSAAEHSNYYSMVKKMRQQNYGGEDAGGSSSDSN